MQAEGNVAENEMHRVFNCGIGLVIVVAAADAAAAMAELKAQGERSIASAKFGPVRVTKRRRLWSKQQRGRRAGLRPVLIECFIVVSADDCETASG
jgi:hypothetical protein